MARRLAVHGTYTKYNGGCRCSPCAEAHATANRTWGRQNTAKTQIYARRKNLKQYGLTLEDYDVLLAEQNGVCAICKKKCATGKRLAVDHCHQTGAIRGLLCYRCNSHLGWLEADAGAINEYLIVSARGYYYE